MDPGVLRETIVLQSKSVTRDAAGGEVVTWTTAASCWAEVAPIGGREFVTLRAAQQDLTHRVRMRYLPGINPGMRLMWRGTAYDVREVINAGARNRELELLCVGDPGNA